MIAYLVVFVTSLGLSLGLSPLGIYLGQRLNIVARPGGRRRHVGNISKLGGVAILGGVVGGVLISLAVRRWLPPSPEGPDPNEMTRLSAVLVGTAVIGLFGFLDDRYELSSKPQYLAQLVVSVVAIAGLVFIKHVRNPFTGELFEFPTLLVWGLTLFWLMGMMNTVNFMDGLNGLCAGVAAIAAAVMVIHMLRVGQYGPALLPLALLGTVLGFMPFNLPGRIFLGSGAVTLGYLIGTLSLVAGARVATVSLVMGIPAVDVAWQIFDRWRHGRSMNAGDRGHLHLRLYDLGLKQWQVVLIYWGFCALFGALALIVSPPLYKLIAIAGLGVMVLAVLALLSRRTRAPG
ncbi:MAG: undecaprenyl/decaprenyl-phosphate alpha-N-acetylglucosaminyl 1-phosphate transferase [Anaerolineae bacterium]|nr:undecaprenyl/decaprenyl-phosphate alpha-N-acetylglucosaminyl 1-phosphate transferase [Anaerolineae bacterium]